MIVFLIISVFYMLQVKEDKVKIEQIAVEYDEKQKALYTELYNEFKNDLENWKPGRPEAHQTSRDPMLTKTVIGAAFSSPDEVEGQKLVDNALALKSADRLSDAADLMEEAFNKWPPLRDRFSTHVKLWRNGISM